MHPSARLTAGPALDATTSRRSQAPRRTRLARLCAGVAGVLLGASALVPAEAAAQFGTTEWRPEATGGEWYLHGALTLTGQFVCGMPFRTPGATCSTSGSSVTITNGGGWMTLTYVGRLLEYDAHYTKTNVYSLGSIERSFGGTAPFVMPSVFTSADRVLGFGNGIVNIAWFGFEDGGRLGVNMRTDGPSRSVVGLAPGALPAPYLSKYNLSWHHLDPIGGTAYNINSTDRTPIQLVGSVSLIAPEPSTYVLLGTGLLTLGVAARRRKRAEA
jgi:hypothetical protein